MGDRKAKALPQSAAFHAKRNILSAGVMWGDGHDEEEWLSCLGDGGGKPPSQHITRGPFGSDHPRMVERSRPAD